jgi:hypothetical protein
MEELFRFILTRPAQAIDPEATTVPVQTTAGYRKELEMAAAADNPRVALRRAAAAHRESAKLASLDDLPTSRPARELRSGLAAKPKWSLSALADLVAGTFGAKPDEVVGSAAFVEAAPRLGDEVVTDLILGGPAPLPLDALAEQARVLDLVRRIAAKDKSLEGDEGVIDAMTRTLFLPPGIFDRRSVGHGPAPAPESPPDDKTAALRSQRDRLLATYSVLTRIEPEHLAIEPATRATPAQRLVDLPPVAEAYDAEAVRAEGVSEASRSPMLERTVSPARVRTSAIPALAGLRGSALLLKASVVSAFGDTERTVLSERGIDLTRVSLASATERLAAELGPLEIQIAAADSQPASTMMLLGKSYVPATIGLAGPMTAGGGPAPATVPSGHGSVAPAGIGDLLVVRQNLKRYEARELADVENILKGEYKERMHRRARTTEETITTEEEIKKEEERDLQTTERFELKTESSEVQKEDSSLKIGLSVSGKYGPVVEFKASTDFALNQSKEESKKIATDYSKDVTSRASSKVFERRRVERILKTIEVFEERNTHGFDNKTGDGPVIGQYQWLDKIYEAQVFNYGKRLLFDIMLPEPAAFLLYTTASQPKGGEDLVKPVPFTAKPTDVSEFNYAWYVKQYGAQGVDPPPEPYMTTSKVVEGRGDGDDGLTTKTLEMPISDGYQALSAVVMNVFTLSDDDGAVDIILDKQGHRFEKNSGWSWSLSLSNETGSLAVGVKTWHTGVFATEIEISCQRTPRALDVWRLKTYDSILQAYQKLERDYEEALAAKQVEAANAIVGRNPLENERMIRAELKKGAISVFTAQQYDLFGAITTSAQGYPEPNLPVADAEGRYIRFFEQAFEWEQMMWFFYPYFWGRKANWTKRVLLDDVDALFADFIRAGAARVVLSVRPGFEHAVATYLETGAIWDGGDLPPIGSPLYVSIIEEIRERDQAPGDEVEQGDPWDVRLPTTLVKIRDDNTLPAWQKNAQGEWVPI